MVHLHPPSLPPWLSALLPPEIRRSIVDVEGLHLHVMELGQPSADAPSIVMLHGNPTWGFLYRRVAEHLARGRHIVLPDLPGLGFSDKPRDPAWHTLARHGHIFGALLDRLALRALVFVGQDWGGAIGLRALADRPERIRGLVLMNTVVGPPHPGFRPTAFHRLSQAPIVSDLAFRLLGVPQIGLHLAQGDRRSIRGAVARAYRYPLRHLRDRAAPLGLARMVPDRLDHPSVADLERCRALVQSYRGPAALVWGERDPILGRLLARTHRLLPQAEVTRTQAGHFLQEEVPEAIAAAIEGVLARALAPST